MRVDREPAEREAEAAASIGHAHVLEVFDVSRTDDGRPYIVSEFLEGEDFHEYVDEVPRASLPVTWAALDCTGGWAADLEERMMVLGRITAEIDALPAIGEEHVVVGQLLGVDGRKSLTAATLYDADGRIVGRARHTWIAVDRATFA